MYIGTKLVLFMYNAHCYLFPHKFGQKAVPYTQNNMVDST